MIINHTWERLSSASGGCEVLELPLSASIKIPAS